MTFTAAMLYFSSCTEPNDAGIEVLPGDDLVNAVFVDTFSIEIGTNRIDSVVTERLSRTMVGNYVDDQLGHVFAESYLQFRLGGSNLVFGNDPDFLSLDSIVLRLDLTNFYGKYNDPIPLEVLEITQDFPVDTLLASNLALNVSQYDQSAGSKLDFSKLAGFLDFVDLRLDDSLGRKLLFSDPDSTLNNGVFTTFFKGLCIRSSSVSPQLAREPGGIFNIDPTSTSTRMTLYYKDTATSKSVVFDVNSNSDRYTRIYRQDYQTRLLQQAIDDSRDPMAQYGVIEAGALVNLFVKIPAISTLDPAAINKAELILNVDPAFLGSIDRFAPPTRVFLFVANEDGTAELDPNAVISTADYNPVTRRYVIPLTNNLQTILAGRAPDNGFIIVPNDFGVSMNRAIIAGPGHPTLAPKMRVIYTTLPE